MTRHPQTGMALVLVLWAVALLTIMAGSFSLSLRRDSGLLHTTQARSQGLALADAGIHYAMLMLSLPDPAARWKSDGRPYTVTLPSGTVRIAALDEAGKIDVNAASEGTLNALFANLLGDADKARALTDAILDWRDPDELKRLSGAEVREYQDAGKPYSPQNKNFRTLEELQMVLGMTPQLFRKLQPALTIFSGQDGLNPGKAAREALLMLPGMDPATVDDYIRQREAAQPNMPPPALVVPPNGVRLHGAGDIAYTIVAETETAEGARIGVRAILRRQASPNGSPFVFQDWKSSISSVIPPETRSAAP